MHLKNRNADITIGVVNNRLYVQRGQMREYYGTIIGGKAKRCRFKENKGDQKGEQSKNIFRVHQKQRD
jgi:hypothetical protein